MSDPIFEPTTVKIKTEEELKIKFQEVAHILHNLRFFTKYWNEHGGFEARKRMNYWQDKADAVLDSLGLILHHNIKSVTVIKDF